MKVYPVIHITSPEVAETQADLAFDLGADGVYLIDHISSVENLFETFNRVKTKHPSEFVGINPLLPAGALGGLRLLKNAFANGNLKYMPDGLWIDQAGKTQEEIESIGTFKTENPELRTVKLLGGVAFKYTNEYTDEPTVAAELAKKAAPFMDVVTTSGEGTGKPPSVEKIKAMKMTANTPIAIASGISPENVAQYAGYADEVLVASSVETSPYSGVFSKERLKELIDGAHSGSQ